MKRYLLVFCFVVYIINCASQVYEAPIFDRSDRDSIRIEKVIITEDTTYLYFTCIIEDDWVNISSQTFLEDPETQERFRIIKSEGIPLLKAKFDEENISYGELNYRNFNQQKDNQDKNNEGTL